jgi:hypothetical protein
VSAEQIKRLREDLAAAIAERDRLRAVVDAVRAYQQAMFGLAPGFSIEDLDAQSVQTNAAWQQVREALAQLDVSPTMGIPERERIVHEDQELRASLERGMGQAAAGEVEGRGDFTRYVAVDPTSPTYDPDQYGTPDTGGTDG